MEENKTINYLDITIHRTPSNWKVAIYRKPRFADTIIPYTSNHPPQHKHATIKFLHNRLNTYDLQPDEFIQEENTIQNIMYNNSFPIQTRRPHHPKPQKQRHTTHIHTHTHTPTQKWTTFTYIGKEITYITNVFRRTDISVFFCTNNTIYKRLSPTHHTTDKYTQSGVNKLTYHDCKKVYVGQTEEAS